MFRHYTTGRLTDWLHPAEHQGDLLMLAAPAVTSAWQRGRRRWHQPAPALQQAHARRHPKANQKIPVSQQHRRTDAV
jgi:hypothetical protein